MDQKRLKGRPRRQSGDAGRDKLIAAARMMLRSRSQIELSGKELALAAGVTPALVRYYFQSRSSIIEAAAQPVIDDYLMQLDALVAADTTLQVKLLGLVKFLLRISRDNGQLIESYTAYVKNGNIQVTDFLARSFVAMSRFIAECEGSGFFRASDAAVTQTVIWGACKTVAQQPELRELCAGPAATAEDVEDRQAALICEIILSGLGGPASVTTPER